VRQERGSINRFLYSFAMLAPFGEDSARPDLSLWNGRLVYWFQAGVGIGHTQGKIDGGSMNPDILGQGYAIVHSGGNNAGTHYNLQLAGETAMMTKEAFVKRYGVPSTPLAWAAPAARSSNTSLRRTIRASLTPRCRCSHTPTW